MLQILRRDLIRAPWVRAGLVLRAAVLAGMAALLVECAVPGGITLPGTDRLGGLRVYAPAGPARHLVLLLSGDGGWNSGLEAIAAGLKADGALVAGIDSRSWLARMEREPASCAAPGRQLESVSHALAQHYGLTVPALLVGHSAGATLAVIALAQASPRTFRGALTLAFCPELDLSVPVCPSPSLRGVSARRGQRLQPLGALPGPWIDVHGLADAECPAPPARQFIARVPGALFIGLPGVGHSFGAARSWWPQFLAAFSELVRSDPLPALAGVTPP
ncbi:MAG: hypothetical protein JO341_04745 [Gammaproteobacteria bacterium]|nr:hypothetical protein [Gammaproteobacteria bacterium]MBV9620311.1 hypothetical protein [Gammaproteobacteria bacterium]